ncbi:MAG TPA: non-canonical purine NTP pyrophosphatase [Actinomycetota bacterium]|nr:non-canonical purine NTP pyrophosphatase [Actinomycetota bacterium]
MPFPKRLAIASRNPHKLRELGRICSDWPVEWVTVETHDGPWPDVDEPHETYLENAAEKALAVASALGIPAMADDSGLEVDGLGGGPGPRSARFAGEDASDEANLATLISVVEEMPLDERRARYVCLAVVSTPEGGAVSADGTCNGTLVTRRRGERGFGYDPIFVPDQTPGRTMAELADEEKDRISHRGRAFRALRELVAADG